MIYQSEDDGRDINKIKFQYDSAINSKEQLLVEQSKNNNLLIDLENDIKILEDVKTLLETLKNYKMDSKKEFILNTINAALQDVFEQNVRIDIEMNASNKSGASAITTRYDIVLYQNDIEMARNEKLLENNGGGILSFISILFKILVGYIYSNSKFYLFDESISQVSSSYRARLARFLKKFCEEYNFTIILISHTDDIDEHAHVGYRLQGTFDKTGVPVLSIGDIFGEYPSTDYNYVHIKNFQSIVEATFRYKGFCVIRGDNNIGKSASFRAINALLFNTFDTGDFPRINRPRGSNVEIDFGYFKTAEDIIENEKNRIKMCYKAGQKVVYEFDGEEYAGKSLAFEKIKEKVETLGFKYVNLKETYKNFKGNLKDQTERLALTTQHDGFYLVGNKSNETEKVFNFLFDSTAVSSAIMQSDNDAKDINNRYQMITSANNRINIQLKQVDLLIEKYSMLFYKCSIQNYIDQLKVKNIVDAQIIVIKDLIKQVTEALTILTHLENYKSYLEIRVQNDRARKYYENNIAVIELCINKLNDANALKYYIERINEFKEMLTKRSSITSSIESINSKTLVINRCIELLNLITFDKNVIDKIKSYQTLLVTREAQNIEYNAAKNKVDTLSAMIENYARVHNDCSTYAFYIAQFNDYFQRIQNRQSINNMVSNYQVQVEKLDDLINTSNFVIQMTANIKAYKEKLIYKDTLIQNIHECKQLISEVENEYRSAVPFCPCCQGTGIDPTHPAHAAKLQEMQWQPSTH